MQTTQTTAAIEPESFADDLLAAVTADGSAIPEGIDATVWADAILGDLRPVAPPDFIAFAETIRANDWDYVGETIYPAGPTVAELRRALEAPAR